MDIKNIIQNISEDKKKKKILIVVGIVLLLLLLGVMFYFLRTPSAPKDGGQLLSDLSGLAPREALSSRDYQLAPTIELYSDRAAIAPGESATISWSAANATSCSDGEGNPLKLKDDLPVSPAEQYTFEVNCIGPKGVEIQSLTIQVTNAPVINIIATPQAVPVGGKSQITWNTINADRCTDSKGGALRLNGNMSVSPTKPYTFDITCFGPNGIVKKSITVAIAKPGSPEAVAQEQRTQRLIASASGILGARGVSVSSTHGAAPRSESGYRWYLPSPESRPVLATSDGWYVKNQGETPRHTSEDPQGKYISDEEAAKEEDKVKETTQAPEAVNLTLTADKLNVAAGEIALITWTAKNASECTAWTATGFGYSDTQTGDVSQMDPGDGQMLWPQKGSVYIHILSGNTLGSITIGCSGSDRSYTRKTVTITKNVAAATVTAQPTTPEQTTTGVIGTAPIGTATVELSLTFTTNKSTVGENEPALVTWKADGASSCDAWTTTGLKYSKTLDDDITQLDINDGETPWTKKGSAHVYILARQGYVSFTIRCYNLDSTRSIRRSVTIIKTIPLDAGVPGVPSVQPGGTQPNITTATPGAVGVRVTVDKTEISQTEFATVTIVPENASSCVARSNTGVWLSFPGDLVATHLLARSFFPEYTDSVDPNDPTFVRVPTELTSSIRIRPASGATSADLIVRCFASDRTYKDTRISVSVTPPSPHQCKYYGAPTFYKATEKQTVGGISTYLKRTVSFLDPATGTKKPPEPPTTLVTTDNEVLPGETAFVSWYAECASSCKLDISPWGEIMEKIGDDEMAAIIEEESTRSHTVGEPALDPYKYSPTRGLQGVKVNAEGQVRLYPGIPGTINSAGSPRPNVPSDIYPPSATGASTYEGTASTKVATTTTPEGATEPNQFGYTLWGTQCREISDGVYDYSDCWPSARRVWYCYGYDISGGVPFGCVDKPEPGHTTVTGLEGLPGKATVKLTCENIDNASMDPATGKPPTITATVIVNVRVPKAGELVKCETAWCQVIDFHTRVYDVIIGGGLGFVGNAIGGAVDFVSGIGGAVGSLFSDARLKKEIVDYSHGLDFILKLRPVTYKYKADLEGKTHSGFIAQEVEAIGIPFFGLNKPKTKDDYYSLNYAEFVVPLVNAVKELKLENDTLRLRIEALEKVK